MVINAVCEKTGQAEALRGVKGLNRIYSPENILPYVFRNEDADKCDIMLNKPYLLIRNPDEIGYLKDRGYDGEIVADHSVYTFNSLSEKLLKDLGVSSDTAPLELNFHELRARGVSESELMVYGRIPMMISAGCLYKDSHNDKCFKYTEEGKKFLEINDLKHEIMIKDRMKAGFPVICDCRFCYNILLNSVPLSLHSEWDKVKKLSPGSVRLYFTTEKAEEAKEIARFFVAYNSDRRSFEAPFKASTKGHFIKGVM
ncbi:MAG: hypothetical protein K6G03_05945 [Lachnospiraceae bacterium]|nr:hypothetical protein [Lachnospiraceae bacterium]